MNRLLRSDVHCAAIGRDVVILDLAEDAYFCISEAMTSPGPFALDRLTPEAGELFLDAGLLASRPAEAARRPQVELPTPARDLRHIRARRPGGGDVLAAMAALSDLRRRGRDPTVAALLASVAGAARHGPARLCDPYLAGLRAATFAELLPWLPFEGACLRRSALLMAWLRLRGLRAHWVFGVRVWPFRAHCWVQIDDLCLNDDVERLAAYTPILIA